MQCVIFSMHGKETGKEKSKPSAIIFEMVVILFCFMQSFKAAYENKGVFGTIEIM